MFEPFRNRYNHFRGMQHPDFYGINADVFHNGVNLQRNKFRRNRINSGHGTGVLSGQGANYGHTVASQGGKRLQIRLDSGTAAAIGAGNGQQPVILHDVFPFGCGCRLITESVVQARHSRQFSRMIRRRCSAAFCGSGAEQIAETTARLFAPAWMTSAAFEVLMPTIATRG